MTFGKFKVDYPLGKDLYVYGDKETLQHFIDDTFETEVAEDAYNALVPRPAVSRRRYPGDSNPVSVKAGTRRYDYDPTAVSARALPGKTVRIRPMTGEQKGLVREFTYQGRFCDLKDWITDTAKISLYLHSPGGKRHKIVVDPTP